MYPEKPNLVDPRKISNGSYAAGIVLSDEMQQTLNQTQCRPQLATLASFSCFVTFFSLFVPFVAILTLAIPGLSGRARSRNTAAP
jgi:hypothetical protein